MDDGLGVSLVGLCIESGSFNEAVHQGLEPWMLLGKVEDTWDYCIGLCRRGDFPTRDEIEAKFDIKLTIIAGATIESLVRRLKTRSHLNELKPIFEEASKQISEGNPVEATDILLQSGRLRAKYSPRKDIGKFGYKENFEERILMYRLMKESGGILGAATRWPSLNRSMKGWQDGLFHVILSLTGLGKSWTMMLICNDLLLQGRRPLIVSTEMAPLRLQFRLDCIRYKMPFPMIRDGSLPEAEELDWMRRMFDESSDLTSDAIFVGKEQVKSVADVQLIAREYNVTDVLVDGGYRLGKDREWGTQQQIIQESQEAAESSNMPWIYTTLLGDSLESGKSFEKKSTGRWKARYAKEWETDPDVVIYLSQPKDLALINQMNWRLVKWRDGDGTAVDFNTHWDPKTMNYDEVEVSEEIEEVIETIAAEFV